MKKCSGPYDAKLSTGKLPGKHTHATTSHHKQIRNVG